MGPAGEAPGDAEHVFSLPGVVDIPEDSAFGMDVCLNECDIAARLAASPESTPTVPFSDHDIARALGGLASKQALNPGGESLSCASTRHPSKENGPFSCAASRVGSKVDPLARDPSFDLHEPEPGSFYIGDGGTSYLDHSECLSHGVSVDTAHLESVPDGSGVVRGLAVAAQQQPQALHRSFTPQTVTTVTSRSHLDRWSDRDETLIIFDWDDTLCPTTHSEDNPGCKDTEQHILRAHEQVVKRLLSAANEVGQVAIVSMAGNGWIDRTLDLYMPDLRSLIEELNIGITLARENVTRRTKLEAHAEERDPSTYLKRRTMMKVVRKFYKTSIGNGSKERSWKNVLSIGDSTAEKLALQDVVLSRVQRDRKGRWKDCRCKTVKLKSEPTLEELSAQLCRLTESLPALVNHDGDMDYEFDDDEVQEALAHFGVSQGLVDAERGEAAAPMVSICIDAPPPEDDDAAR